MSECVCVCVCAAAATGLSSVGDDSCYHRYDFSALDDDGRQRTDKGEEKNCGEGERNCPSLVNNCCVLA